MADRVVAARLVLMPGMAHLPPVEDPNAFVAVVAEFLQGLTGRT